MYEWVTIKTSYCDWIKIIMFFSVLDTIFKINIPRDAKKFIKNTIRHFHKNFQLYTLPQK